MKRIAFILMSLVAICASAQSIDQKIGNAMNNSDWFALDSIYNSVPKDSINNFLEIFSRCLIGNRLNRPDISIPAFQELLNTQSASLDLGNLVSSAYMFGMDLSRVGKNDAAAAMTGAILNAAKPYLDSMTVAGLTSTANRYSALSEYNPYQIEFENKHTGIVPFTIVPVGPTNKNSVLMHLQDSYINGIEADITFDTGAGSNIISPEMADHFKLIPLDNTRITVKGVNRRDGYIAIAKELRIGNIIVRDVPFTVISLSSDNEEADKYIDSFSIVVGSELMLQLKDLTIDFSNRKITIPVVAPQRSSVPANLCFSSTMNLLSIGSVLSNPMLMCLDSGNASFGVLSKNFLDANKDYIISNSELDTIREAGIGGTINSPCYKVMDMPVSLGGNTVFPPELIVRTNDNSTIGDYYCIIGVKTLMMYETVHFNLVDFVLSTESPQSNHHTTLGNNYKTHNFDLKKDYKPNLLQALGLTTVGIARMLINPNAPATPDL